MTAQNDINKLSETLLLNVKMEHDNNSAIKKQLEQLSLSDLKNRLSTDNFKKAFWINIYNAYFQILRKQQNVQKPDIYRKKLVLIAGRLFSLDDIEHGILRKYRYKYSLGLLAKWFTPKIIKQLAVDTLDYRIHFALNCGAKSCPPIAFYKLATLDHQLDMSSQSFLEGETKIDHENKLVYTSQLFKWFAFDFGGIQGIKQVITKYLDVDLSQYSLRFTEYAWDEALDNFVEDN